MKAISYDREKKVIVTIGNGEEVVLRPKERELWDFLVEQSPNIVSRKLLEAHIWAGRYVTDFTINQTINSLRRKIGDLSREIIITKPRKGYAINFEKVDTHLTKEDSAKPIVEVTHNREGDFSEETEDVKIVPTRAVGLAKHSVTELAGGEQLLAQNSGDRNTSVIDKIIKTLPLIFILIASNAASIGLVAVMKKDKKDDVAYIDGYRLKFSGNSIEYFQDEGKKVRCSLLRGLTNNDEKENFSEGTICKITR